MSELISPSEVEKVAYLARLAINEQELAHSVKELSSILELVAQMKAIDTSQVTPMAHPLDLPQRLRKDVVTEPNQRDLFQSIAPKAEAGYYMVPQVIE
ncbi:MAG: Asp-tRNA(Asn)/Glu-tRNA(Gln) amidotransferase subunit GatC [Gammaproteobacteria bacterium]